VGSAAPVLVMPDVVAASGIGQIYRATSVIERSAAATT
jgi:hypothetical protein